jgi:general stress protein 26
LSYSAYPSDQSYFLKTQPKTDVRPMMRRRDGVKYLEMWNPAWQDMKPVQELINQVLSEGKKS